MKRVVTCHPFDKNDVEEGVGEVRLSRFENLTIIDWAVAMINARLDVTESVDINHIPLDDPRVYQLLQSVETTVVFQLESRG